MEEERNENARRGEERNENARGENVILFLRWFRLVSWPAERGKETDLAGSGSTLVEVVECQGVLGLNGPLFFL